MLESQKGGFSRVPDSTKRCKYQCLNVGRGPNLFLRDFPDVVGRHGFFFAIRLRPGSLWMISCPSKIKSTFNLLEADAKASGRFQCHKTKITLISAINNLHNLTSLW